MGDAWTLIFPNQLFKTHPSLDRSRPVMLVEDTLFFGDATAAPGRFHRQKIVLHRASMKSYEAKLRSEGYDVHYVDYRRDCPVDLLLKERFESQAFGELFLVDPVDFLALKRVRRFCELHGVQIKLADSPSFLTPLDWANDHFGSRKRPFMSSFYEAQRKRMGILLDSNGKPAGGRWSFDDENRKSMPKRGLDVPPRIEAARDSFVEEALAYVESNFLNYPGGIDHFVYAVDHAGAESWLESFLVHRMQLFGPYEDALATDESILFHSQLTPMMNIGLLTPEFVVNRVQEFSEANDVPLNSLEGFIRQVIGWREFIRLMYLRHGVEMRNGNFFDHQRPIPESMWKATTGIFPMDLVIKRTLDTGYAHHIERLMVLGNFMLLCQYNPNEVYRWFMELFIDAYDWVMVPNVYGMSQFADGGIFTTKPYISGSNYLKKMSDYSTGDWAPTWDGLFWSFVGTNLEFFRKQYRLGMLVRNWEKMDGDKKEAHIGAAQAFLSR